MNSLAAVRMFVGGAFVCWCPAGASFRGRIGFEGCVVGRTWDVVWEVGVGCCPSVLVSLRGCCGSRRCFDEVGLVVEFWVGFGVGWVGAG